MSPVSDSFSQTNADRLLKVGHVRVTAMLSPMTKGWDERVDEFWADANDADASATLALMLVLVEQRPKKDPEAIYEWASIHDFLGLEAEAIPLYEEALSLGLDGPRRAQAVIQLASSLRNVGNPEAAADILSGVLPEPVTGDAAQAFLALALHDRGEPSAALRVALRALAKTLPLYSSVIARYADALAPSTDATDSVVSSASISDASR